MLCEMFRWDSLPARWKRDARLSRTSKGSNNGLQKRRLGCPRMEPCRLAGADARSRSRLSKQSRKWKRIGE